MYTGSQVCDSKPRLEASVGQGLHLARHCINVVVRCLGVDFGAFQRPAIIVAGRTLIAIVDLHKIQDRHKWLVGHEVGALI